MLLLVGMSDEIPTGVPAQGGNKKLLLSVLAFNVLLAGGLGYQVVLGQKNRDADKQHAGANKTVKAEPEGQEFGPIIDVGSLVANIGGADSQHYVKVTLHVEAINEDAKEAVEAAVVPIRSDALLYLSGVPIGGQSTQGAMRSITADLQLRVIKMLGKKRVRRVYFSEFVFQ